MVLSLDYYHEDEKYSQNHVQNFYQVTEITDFLILAHKFGIKHFLDLENPNDLLTVIALEHKPYWEKLDDIRKVLNLEKIIETVRRREPNIFYHDKLYIEDLPLLFNSISQEMGLRTLKIINYFNQNWNKFYVDESGKRISNYSLPDEIQYISSLFSPLECYV